MKVLYLTNIPAPYRVIFFNELGKNVDLTVLFERKSSSERDKSWENYAFKNFKGIFLKSSKIGVDGALSFEVIKYLNSKKYDQIILGGYSTPTGILSSIYMRLKKIKYILNIDGGLIKNDSLVQLAIKKFLLKCPTFYLSPGKEGNKYLKYYGVKEEKIFNYPFTSVKGNEILEKPLSDDQKLVLKKELGLKEKITIISVGRFIHEKGFDILLKAMKGINLDLNVIIIGGKAQQKYLEIIKEKKLKNIHFLDFMTKKELNKYYMASDLFILPTRGDVWGLVINEAMANGLPAITTNKCVAGLEMINNKNGFLYPVENITSLSEKIKLFFEKNESERNKMSLEALKTIRKYSIENMAKEHINILKKIEITKEKKYGTE